MKRNKSEIAPYFVLRFHNNGDYIVVILRAGTRRMNHSYEPEWKMTTDSNQRTNESTLWLQSLPQMWKDVDPEANQLPGFHTCSWAHMKWAS